MKKKFFSIVLIMSAVFLLVNTVSYALVSVGDPIVLSTEWEVAYDNHASNVILSELTLINIHPKCIVSSAVFVIDVYLIFYDNKERPVFHGVIRELTERDITKVDILNILGLANPGIPGKGTVAIMAVPPDMPPCEAVNGPLTDVLDGYLTQKVYNNTSLSTIIGTSKTGFLGSTYFCIDEFCNDNIKWVDIDNN